MSTIPDFAEGEILLFDKPFDWSSFDLVKKIRYAIKKKLGKEVKVGHAGTLDPYATGLMILCTGKFTKKIESIQGQEKEYTGIIRLGATTPSYDLESEIDAEYPTGHITLDMLKDAMHGMTGEQDQVPPAFSAKMIDGKRAYELARKGQEVTMKPNRVTIYQFDLEKFENNEVHFIVRCSKGTYIRSMAHDLGKKLGSGGHLTRLVRTGIGAYRLEDAFTIEQFMEKLAEG